MPKRHFLSFMLLYVSLVVLVLVINLTTWYNIHITMTHMEMDRTRGVYT